MMQGMFHCKHSLFPFGMSPLERDEELVTLNVTV